MMFRSNNIFIPTIIQNNSIGAVVTTASLHGHQAKTNENRPRIKTRFLPIGLVNFFTLLGWLDDG